MTDKTIQHDPNCAVVRHGDIRAWCDCGKVKLAKIVAKLTNDGQGRHSISGRSGVKACYVSFN